LAARSAVGQSNSNEVIPRTIGAIALIANLKLGFVLPQRRRLSLTNPKISTARFQDSP
jgi:hypothetical protein